jgi:hypothetical protein
MNLLTLPVILAQASESTDLGSPEVPQMNPVVGGVMGIIWLAVVILMIASLWKVFTKAGQPGWAAIIPIYNLYILCKVGGKSGWWVLLLLIPFVNFIIAIILCIAIAERFGKGAGFGVGLAFLGFIFFPILAFGDARYQGAGAPPLPGAAAAY